MYWIKSGIENPSKSEVIGRCGGMKKPNDHTEPTKSNAKKINKKIILPKPDKPTNGRTGYHTYTHTIHIGVMVKWPPDMFFLLLIPPPTYIATSWVPNSPTSPCY